MAVWDALLAFMAATAQAQAEATKEAQRARIDHAKTIRTRYLGRKPTFSREHVTLIRELAAIGSSVGAMMKTRPACDALQPLPLHRQFERCVHGSV